MNEAPGKRRGWSWWYLLFIVQFVAVLWPPFYNSVEPSFARYPVLLLVPDAVGDHRRGVHRGRVLRHRQAIAHHKKSGG